MVKSRNYLVAVFTEMSQFPWVSAKVYRQDSAELRLVFNLDAESVFEIVINVEQLDPFQYIYYAIYYQKELVLSSFDSWATVLQIVEEYFSKSELGA